MMAPSPLSAPPHYLAGFFKSVERPCSVCSFPTRLRAPSGVWIHPFCAASPPFVRQGENSCDRRRRFGTRPHVKPRASEAEIAARLQREIDLANRRFPVGTVGTFDGDDLRAGRNLEHVRFFEITRPCTSYRPRHGNPHGLERACLVGSVVVGPRYSWEHDHENICHPSSFESDKHGHMRRRLQQLRDEKKKGGPQAA